MSAVMENLINNKFYATKEEVEKKLGVFFVFNVVTEADYTILMQLSERKYTSTTTTQTTA